MRDITKMVVRIGSDGSPLSIKGRIAWALSNLIEAGERGCTPIENPGPRWSDYVFKLKRKHGLDIETVHEAHGGAFPGSHARYVLRSAVVIVRRSDEQEARAA